MTKKKVKKEEVVTLGGQLISLNDQLNEEVRKLGS